MTTDLTLSFDADEFAAALLPAVLEAGRAELRYFRSDEIRIETKADRTPVTAADREAEAIVLSALARLAPGIPVVAEEAVAAGSAPVTASRFFLVDALDGTHLFIRGKPEFSVNIALIDTGRPVFGLIYLPPAGRLFLTRSDGKAHAATAAADLITPNLPSLDFTPLSARAADPANIVAFNSRSAGGACAEFLTHLNVAEARPVGSSQKFCLIAEGAGDVYARFGTTYEWDTAAGQAILEAAGGSVLTLDGARLAYGKTDRGYLNPHFLAWGRSPLLKGFVPSPGSRKSAAGA